MTTLSYDTAKKLKGAGFPLRVPTLRQIEGFSERSRHLFPERYPEYGYFVVDSTLYLIPTLSELIEACRKECDEFRIHIYPHGVVIERPEYGDFRLDDMEIQLTPEEAVANLWIAIHTQKGG